MTHPPLFTVADSQALRGEIAGGHTKNLFLKDKKDQFFLVTVEENATVDLKQIHHLIGAASRVSFGKPEALMELLGVAPGAVTAFGVINDTDGRVKLVLDEALMAHAVDQRASAGQHGDDLDCGRRSRAFRARDRPRTCYLESLAMIATCWADWRRHGCGAAARREGMT